MDPIRRISRPSLDAPRAVMAFEGWNDACEAASGAAGFLASQSDTEPFALIEPEEFYDFQVRRPTVAVIDGATRSLEWPTTRFSALITGGAHDLVIVAGEEPSLRWKTYARHVAQVLSESDVDLAVTLGAFIGQVAHTSPAPVFGSATDPALLGRYRLEPSQYEGPTGIVGVMLEALRERGIPSINLWAATPHYLSANPNPPAMLSLLRAASPILEVDFELAELETAAEEFRAKVDEALASNEELAAYVRRLEDDDPTARELDPGESHRLITEIEQFLRER